MSILTVKELYDKRAEQKRENHEVYRSILRDVYDTIDRRDNEGKRNTIYRVPFIVYGNSRYRVSTAVHYIIQKLAQGGFVVFPHEQNILYIDWSIPHKETTPRPLKSCLKKY